MAAIIPRKLFNASARSNGCKSVRSTYANNSEMALSGFHSGVWGHNMNEDTKNES